MTEQTRRLMRRYEEQQIQKEAADEQLRARASAMTSEELQNSDLPDWVRGWISRRRMTGATE